MTSRDRAQRFLRREIFTPGMRELAAAAPGEVKFLWKAMKLRKGSRVLDIPCGTGRHAVELARRGAAVLGVDISPAYLREARRASRGLANARFVRGDMRRLAPRGEFDAAINLWSSFGYFDKPSEDLKTLRGVARALKPGGLFLIDVLDYKAAKGGAQTKRVKKRADGAYLLEEFRFPGGADPKIVIDWTLLRPGKAARASRFALRGYDRKRLFTALRQAGFKPLKTWTALGEGKPGCRLVALSIKTPER
jgi:SAM-dependent methyltransferase